MPWHEHSFGPESVFLRNESFRKDIALMGHLGDEVVYEEGLREVVFVVGVWHRFEVDCHHCAGLNVTNLVHASC